MWSWSTYILPAEEGFYAAFANSFGLPGRIIRANNLRAASRGPVAYGTRVVRRKVYGKSVGATAKLLKIFGLK